MQRKKNKQYILFKTHQFSPVGIEEEVSAVDRPVGVEVGHALNLGQEVLGPEAGPGHGQDQPLGQVEPVGAIYKLGM